MKQNYCFVRDEKKAATSNYNIPPNLKWLVWTIALAVRDRAGAKCNGLFSCFEMPLLNVKVEIQLFIFWLIHFSKLSKDDLQINIPSLFQYGSHVVNLHN